MKLPRRWLGLKRLGLLFLMMLVSSNISSNNSPITKTKLGSFKLVIPKKVSYPDTLAGRNKNPGNLTFKRHLVFASFKAGTEALRQQVIRYQSGTVTHARGRVLTLEAYCKTYAEDVSYTKKMSRLLREPEDKLIRDIHTDSLVKYHTRLEDIRVHRLLIDSGYVNR